MAAGSRYGVYRDLLCRGGLSLMVIGGRCKAGLTKSAVKGLLKQSQTVLFLYSNVEIPCPHFPLQHHGSIVASHL